MFEHDERFVPVLAAYTSYYAARKRFVETMKPYGIATGNMDPLVDFAEIVVACELNGQLQPRANKDVNVVTLSGLRIQVKSLRVSTDRPQDNPLNWLGCTRRKLKDSTERPLISAEKLAVVVYLDSALYALLTFPITLVDRFPAAGVKDLFFSHVKKLLNEPDAAARAGVQVKDLRQE